VLTKLFGLSFGLFNVHVGTDQLRETV
jgi:hypothetical protein